MPDRLTGAGRTAALAGLPAWKEVAGRDAITPALRVRRFLSPAFGWMTLVALVAEKADHHPEWLNVYNALSTVTLSTHDAGGLTGRDIALAMAMDRLAAG